MGGLLDAITPIKGSLFHVDSHAGHVNIDLEAGGGLATRYETGSRDITGCFDVHFEDLRAG